MWEEILKTAIGSAASAVGFFCALFVNSRLEARKEKRASHSMLVTIREEAKSNANVLNTSHRIFYASEHDLVLRELSTTAVSQGLASPLFVTHVTRNELEVLNEYLRNIRLNNAYREKSELFRLDLTTAASKKFGKTLIQYWGENIDECERSIEKVQRLVHKDLGKPLIP